MTRQVVVSGLGIITALGNNAAECLRSLSEEKTGIGPIRLLSTVHKDHLPAGEIPLSENELCKLAEVEPGGSNARSTLLALIAAREAAREAGLTGRDFYRTGLVSATTVGGMDKTELHYPEFLDLTKEGDFIKYIQSHDCGDCTEEIAKSLGITNFITTLSTACSSSANAIMLGARLIKSGLVDRVIAGGTDALSLFTLNGFNSLMILDSHWCQPFDENRRGLNLGEGAAYLVLEEEQIALKRGQKPMCRIAGYANTNDAFHQTASSPDGDGAFAAMSEALQMANLKPSQIDYINAHGTGTENNDLSEGRAIKRLFAEAIPPFSSTKPYTGHTLAAAGSIEAVISILSIREGIIFPNLNFITPIAGLDGVAPTTRQLTGQNIIHVMSNSFGFGGNNTSLIYSKY